jgi:hypothetical protein
MNFHLGINVGSEVLAFGAVTAGTVLAAGSVVLGVGAFVLGVGARALAHGSGALASGSTAMLDYAADLRRGPQPTVLQAEPTV